MSSSAAAVAGAASLAVVAAGLLSGVLALAVTRRPALALGILLDFLVAAGLLRLIGEPDWQAILTAAVVVAMRHLVGYGLRLGARSWTGRGGGGRPRSATGAAARLLHPAWRL